MKRLLPTTFSILLVFFFASCGDSEKQHQNRSQRFGYRPPETGTETLNDDQPTKPDGDVAPTSPTAGREGQTPAHPDPKPAPPTAPAHKDYPYAKPVEGKPGYVVSPYAPYSGYVDVKGIPPGSEVACPYTSSDKVKKIFLVP